MRLACFTPWPPQRSGIAGRSAELVPRLASLGHGVDVFVHEGRVPVVARQSDEPVAPGTVRVLGAHDFLWRQRRAPYDLAVYQIGNSVLHDFIWPYLFRFPGLTILHDARLHHARGRALLSAREAAVYREEFAWAHPEVSPDAAELGVLGLGGTYLYGWPMTRAVLVASRLVAAHSRGALAALAEAEPSARMTYVALGEGRATPPSEDARALARQAIGLADGTIAFGLFGELTEEKRVPQVIAALAAIRPRHPDVAQVLVQPMVRGVEMFVGVSLDPKFGRAVVCGSGGTLVELLRDTSCRLTPLTDVVAREMLDELRGVALLRGFRGAEPADESSFRDIVLRVSALVELCPEIQEIDLNPVIVSTRGATAVDARIRVAPSAVPQGTVHTC